MNTKPILLVEDSEDDVRLTRRAFKKNNIANQLIVVGDGVAAMEYLRGVADTPDGRAPELPALILLDLKLPKMDGLEVLRALRAHPKLRRQPVVILTTSKEEQDVITSYDLGANSYIRKPVDFEQFCAALHQLGLYWLVLNEPPPAPPGGPA
ncbi:MAG TPA: response regulator [Candidatus Synoicihabitans sp.]|nr:response regulator [Candidatus Synoicihabitans sp.]